MNTIKNVRHLLKCKEITCRELTVRFLKAAEELNPELTAYITLTREAALKTADDVDKKIQKGEELQPLEGIPFCLKDNISTKGLRTTCASRMLEDYTPIYDAAVWESLKGQNAVIIGKGNMDEFAMGSTCENSYFGGAKNPRNLGHVAGGSSGGVAAAVAGNLAVYGIGSDTGGSIRMPASFCGLVGLKPTYGAVSRRGLIAYGSSLDQIGPIAACTEDAAAVFDEICAKDPLDMTSEGSEPVSDKLTGSVRGLRIGLAKEFFDGLPESVRRPLDEAVDLYRKLGAELVELEFPLLKYVLPTYYIIACAEASSNLGRYDGLRYGHRASAFDDLNDFICRTRSEGFGQEVRRRILLGAYVLSAGYYDAYYNKAQLLRKSIKNEFSKMFSRCDVLLTPTVPVTALKSGAGMTPVQMYQTDICTCSVNIAGLPAVSLPCGHDGKGLPVGMQLIGDKFSEDVVLNASLAFERETEGSHLKTADMGVLL
ncbi:aspartyl/glutamyl-tRNA(Asn/Gln) amidotransferase subunit A [Sporobacter termitidis DSM 10068]|uniref:Glutamyl-tRNA(Gln) amidotransferase subunit A n=1 Tax=Sporobacter termitidis DSM 10068 TaxID=1123282 RepID=A0A1M5X2V5_9FIRM|nr:Asp-tRNA(Asn)/Glu-tRNA(Gln) amidotransferase subunit GatA [Sporobacter termitidis]SHH94206.1 aspartyl/glutamyl-tRNA(Asn/Gln) amidotransferase subunit A [Sporobacter termitidis DSM 10068]